MTRTVTTTQQDGNRLAGAPKTGAMTMTLALVALFAMLGNGLLAQPAASAYAGKANGNGNGNGEAADTGGFESPAEAARAFFSGVRDGNTERLLQAIAPAERESYRRSGYRHLAAIKIESLEFGRTEPFDDGQRAYAYFRWNVSIDVDAAIEAAIADARDHLRQEGLSDEELELALRQHQPQLRRITRQMVDHLQRERQRMILVAIDGRWYVDHMVDPRYRPESRDDEGAE